MILAVFRTWLRWAPLWLPGLAPAFPLDTSVCVKITTFNGYDSSVADSSIFSYGRDGRDWLYVKATEFRSDSVYGVSDKVYDAQRRESRTAEYSPGGKLLFAGEIQYDAAGNAVLATLSDGSKTLTTIASQFDAQGRVLKSTWSDSGGTMSAWVYRYDAQGRLSGRQVMRGDSLIERVEYSYDAQGHEIGVIDLGAAGDTAYTIAETYDAQGRRIRQVKRFPPDTGFNAVFYSDERTEYDAHGDVAAEGWYTRAGKLDRWSVYAYQDLRIAVTGVHGRPASQRGGIVSPASVDLFDLLGRRRKLFTAPSTPAFGRGGSGSIGGPPDFK